MKTGRLGNELLSKKHEAFYWKVKYDAFTPNDETKYMSSYDNEFHTGRNVIQGDQYIIE